MTPGSLITLLILLGISSFLLTWLVMTFALRKKMFDIPNERSSHVVPTPHSGGVAIVITWYIGITILNRAGIMDQKLCNALYCGIVLAIVSLVDDLAGVKPLIRLIIHFATSAAAFYFLGGLRPLIMPGITINYDVFINPLAVLGMVWFINLFNFMDGIDGFASLEAIIVSSVLFVLTWSIPSVMLIACITGFLYWNWPRAGIFMGDVGSTQLGFILVVMGIYYHNIYEFSILNWIMLTSPFWFDATMTLLRRWRNGEKISKAHRKHVYQRVVQAGFSHEKVNLFLLLINLINILMIAVYRPFKSLQIPIFILTLIFYWLITIRVDKLVPFTKDRE